MDICLCIKCGFLGSTSDLKIVKTTSETKPWIKELIKENGFVGRACPKCKTMNIVYKPTTNSTPTLPTSMFYEVIDDKSSEVTDDDILKALMDDIDAGNKNIAIENAPPSRLIRPPPSKYRLTCDACNKPFESKTPGFEGQARCDDCLKGLAKSFGVRIDEDKQRIDRDKEEKRKRAERLLREATEEASN